MYNYRSVEHMASVLCSYSPGTSLLPLSYEVVELSLGVWELGPTDPGPLKLFESSTALLQDVANRNIRC